MNLDNAGIERLLDGMDKDTRAIREEALRLTWWMRGGLTYGDAMCLSKQDKELINSLIEDNIKVTKESGLPFF